MLETGMSGLMSEEGKRPAASRSRHRALPRLYVRPDGAYHQWRKIPPRELSIDLVADERDGWATGRREAS
jgi:hypothetical protein